MPYTKALSTAILASALAVSTPVQAQPPQQTSDFINFATTHCKAMIRDGRADLGFVLGKAAARFSAAQLEEFNLLFSRKLVKDFHVDANQECVLDVVTTKKREAPATYVASADTQAHHESLPPKGHEIAVVIGEIAGATADVPVSVAYRLEQMEGAQGWEITNISLNGQPLADRYREAYETLAKEGGAKAVLGAL